ncbi:hypothetical protein EB155_10685 [archaeon]|nr:hypothetical protein [archaeon]NDB80318.1 hypothetical protein [archaeon]
MKIFAEGPRLNLEQFDVDRDYEVTVAGLEDWAPSRNYHVSHGYRHLRGYLLNINKVERPYTDTCEYGEWMSIVERSSDTCVGATWWQVRPGREVEIRGFIIWSNSRRNQYRNEAARIRDSVLLEHCNVSTLYTFIRGDFPSAQGYQNYVSQRQSIRDTSKIKYTYSTTPAQMETFKNSPGNGNVIPSHTYRGGDWVKPWDR